MITRPINHGLHVILSRELTSPILHMTYQLHPLIYTTSALNSSLHHQIVAISSRSSYKLGHQSALAFFGAELLCVTDYLQIIVFPDLVIVEWEEYYYTLQKKATRGVMSKVLRETAGRTRPSLTLGTSTTV